MASYQGKRVISRYKSFSIFIAILLAVIVLAAVVVFAWTHAAKTGDGQPGETLQGDQAGGTGNGVSSALAFPYSLAEEGVEVHALFSSDLMNPDGGNVMVEQLASLEVTNTSDRYLTSAAFTVTLTDGTVCHFRVNDLPAGGKTVAFSTENAAYDGSACAAITAETEFADGSQLMEESVSFSVDGMTVTLTNLTQEDLGPLTVICHDTLDETEFFGGSSYAYRTETVPAGASVTVEAADCIIGQPAVVRISRDG